MHELKPTTAASHRLTMANNPSHAADSDNPYAAPHTLGGAPAKQPQERKKHSALVWSALGFWFATASFGIAEQVFLAVTRRAPGDGNDTICFVISVSIMAPMFGGVYAGWWWIRTRNLDLYPSRRYHFIGGGSGVLLMALGMYVLFLLDGVLRDFLINGLVPLTMFGSFALAAELCRFVAMRFCYEGEPDRRYVRFSKGEPDV